jgi:hypothetical protein
VSPFQTIRMLRGSTGDFHAADNSLSTATRSNSSLKCLIRYSGGLSSIAGMSPVIIYVPCRAKHAVFWAVVDDGPDLELVEHLYQLTAKAMKGEQDEFGWQDQASRT